MAMREREKSRYTDSKKWAESQSRGFEPTAVKLPEGRNFFKFDKPGTYKIDILPYEAGKGNPRADEGFLHFEREYNAHRLPTPGSSFGRMYCCLWECFKKKCPICEWSNTEGRNADPELVKKLRGTTRNLFNVVDLSDRKAGVQVLDIGHYNRGTGFGELLTDAINAVEAYGNFYHLEDGYTLQCTVKEQSFPGGKYNAVTRIDFLKRDKDYDEKILKDCVCLDDCLVRHTYDDLKKIMNQEGDEPAPKEAHAKNGKPKDDDDEPEEKDQEPETDDEDPDEDSDTPPLKVGALVWYKHKGKNTECEVQGFGKDGSLKLQTDMGKAILGVDPKTVTLIEKEDSEEDEPDPAPAKGSKKKPAAKDPDDDDEPDPESDDDETESEDDEEPEDVDEEDELDEDDPPSKKKGKPAGKPGKKR